MFILLGGIIAAFLAFILASAINRLAIHIGAVDFPRCKSANTVPVSRFGGVLIFISSLASLILILPWLPASWAIAPQIAQKSMAFLLGAILILAIGVLDDIYGLRARWKLLGQIVVAVVIWWAGLRVEVMTNPLDPSDPIYLGVWSLPVFVFWVVLCVNAMNIIDGIDGLAGGIFLLGISFFLVNCLVADIYLLALVSVILLGSVGFFMYSNSRKRMYLGDSGSLLLGFILACIVPFSSPKSAGLAAVLIPLGVLSVPFSEVAVTTLRRIFQGKPVGNADQMHIHHHLLQTGLKVRHVAILINSICFLCGLLALGMTLAFQPKVAIILGFCWLIVLILFFGLGYRTFPKESGDTKQPRNKLFLDGERAIQRKLHDLGKSKNIAEMRNLITEFAEYMTIDYLWISFIDNQGEEIFVQKLGSKNKDEKPGQGAELVIKLRTKGEYLGELRAGVDLVSDNADLKVTGYWLDALLTNLSIWTDKARLCRHSE